MPANEHGDRNDAEVGPAAASSPRPQTWTNPVGALRSVHRKGPRSLINLSLYAVGLSGLWTALGTPLLQIKVEEILSNGGATLLSFSFTEDNKNGALGIVSLLGLAVAALAQPISGVLSDRRSGPGRRMPFLLIGAAGMALSVLFLGIVGSLLSLVVLNIMIQGMGNFGQGAANGLIADHVPDGKKGSAAGALNLSRVAGAGTLTAIVFLFMRNYDQDTGQGWLTASVILLAVMAVATTLWTVTSLNKSKTGEGFERSEEEAAPVTEDQLRPEDESALPHDNYLRFLIALTLVITGFSALQLYSFYYLQDVIGLENAADGGIVILGTTVIAAALTVLPAGRLADRIGRDPMIYTAGGLGVLGAVMLMLANSLVVVAIVGTIIGVVIGIFLTVSWALANDLVSRRHAARDLGYASIAVLIGSAASRISGLGVDRLNLVNDGLGYQVVLGCVAVCFIITVALMTRMESHRDHAADSLPEHAAAD